MYRNGTYIAFHANDTKSPVASDIRYYRLLKAWHANDDVSFRFVNSHEKHAAVRDTSTRETLRRSLCARLNSSKNMVLIIGPTTRFDIDWVPYEIAWAADRCKIPIIVAYTQYKWVVDPVSLQEFWPDALFDRIKAGSLSAIHIPFKRATLDAAIGQFDINNPPSSALDYYSIQSQFGLGLDPY